LTLRGDPAALLQPKWCMAMVLGGPGGDDVDKVHAGTADQARRFAPRRTGDAGCANSDNDCTVILEPPWPAAVYVDA
jgi:hypothetical protein